MYANMFALTNSAEERGLLRLYVALFVCVRVFEKVLDIVGCGSGNN